MRRYPYILFLYSFIFLLSIVSCDNIDKEDRLVYEKPAPAARAVLLEDFTGQRCTNCPKGTEVIEQLVAEYGDTAVIAVGIHGGPLGFHGNQSNIGLATDTGDEYYNHWNLQYQPVGLVNRHGAVNYPEWASAVKEELAKPASLDLKVTADIESSNIRMTVLAYGTDGTTTGKIQVWVLEDGITALQLMPDGSSNKEYVHNHVFRKAVNGIWGEDFTIEEGVTKQLDYTEPLDPTWNAERLSVVAFVYNDNGVEQAAKGKLKN